MPIGSVHKSSSNIAISLDYDLAQGRFAEQEQDKKPEIVATYNIFSRDPNIIKAELKEQANENKRLKNKALRFSVNFDQNDQTPEYKRREFVEKVVQEMGVNKENHQAVITRHNDKHPHYHILVNRVGFDGKTLTDSHTKRRLELAIDKWEKKMNLDNSLEKTRAFVYDETAEKGYKTQVRQKLSKGVNLPQQKVPKKQYVQDEIKKALEKSDIKTPEQLKQELSKKDIDFKYTMNKNGLAGTSFRYKNQALKGSQIGYKASVIRKEFEQKQEQEQSNKFKVSPELTAQQMAFLQRVKEQRQAREQAATQKQFKEQQKKILNDIDLKIKEEKQIHIHEVDNIIRERMREFKPNQNPWATAREIGGEDWENKIHKYAEMKAQQHKNTKTMEKEKAQQQPKTSISTEVGKAKAEMNEAQKRFLQKERELKEKREQEQEQRKGRRR